jgi:hypothetical protein
MKKSNLVTFWCRAPHAEGLWQTKDKVAVQFVCDWSQPKELTFRIATEKLRRIRPGGSANEK